jgi:hypothetical protein
MVDVRPSSGDLRLLVAPRSRAHADDMSRFFTFHTELTPDELHRFTHVDAA